MSKVPKHIYRVFRAVLFAAILTVAALYLIIYVLVSMPAVQKRLVALAEREVSALTGGEAKIGRLEIYPFDEVRLSDVELYSPLDKEGEPCLYVGQLGAGISLFDLLTGKIVLTYAELVKARAQISQSAEGAPYNIQFLIDAFKPKEQKESTNVNLDIRTVVIRKLDVNYDLLWKPEKEGFDPAHLHISNFRADISIPSLDTSPFAIETKVRRIAFLLTTGEARHALEVNDLSFTGKFSETGLSLSKLFVKLPDSRIDVSDLALDYQTPSEIAEAIKRRSPELKIKADVTPADLALFFAPLAEMKQKWNCEVSGRYAIDDLTDLKVSVSNRELGCDLKAEGDIHLSGAPASIFGRLDVERLTVSPTFTESLRDLLPSLPKDVGRILTVTGNPSLDLKATIVREGEHADWEGVIDGALKTAAGDLSFYSEGSVNTQNGLSVKGSLGSDNIELGKLAGTHFITNGGFDVDFDLSINNIEGNKKDIEGTAEVNLQHLGNLSGRPLDLWASVRKEGEQIDVQASSDSEAADFTLDAMAKLDDELRDLFVNLDVSHLNMNLFGLGGKFSGATVSGAVAAEINGFNLNTLDGAVNGENLLLNLADGRSLELNRLILSAETFADDMKRLSLKSDYADCDLSGHFQLQRLPSMVAGLTEGLLPSLNPLAKRGRSLELLPASGDIDLSLTVNPLGQLADFLNLPVRPLVPADLSARADFGDGSAQIELSAPYLQKGSSSLLTETHLKAEIPARGKLLFDASTNWPFKDRYFPVNLRSDIYGDRASLNLGISPDGRGPLTGSLQLDLFASNILSPALSVILNASTFTFNDEDWNIERGEVLYSANKLTARNVKIAHADQFLLIDGIASKEPEDLMSVTLEDIDLSFIFDTLNIDYVHFGGRATGRVEARELFSKTPSLKTIGLKTKDFSYADALLGDADLRGDFNVADKSIGIGAHIYDPREDNRRTADVDGRIWLGRDSLSFNFDADKLNASFLGQFMSMFASDLSAKASGKVHLFGTFKNLDLRGHAYADSLRFKLDYTGVYYTGSDSVFMDPGCIRIPSFRIYDRDGHSGVFSGELRHRCLHDARFDFRLKDASRLLAYDLPRLSPDDFWWGTVYASGDAVIHGVPGLTAINVEMNTDRDSEFFFALSDSEAAKEYNFLTFTDKTRVSEEPLHNETPDFVSLFRRKKKVQEDSPSNVHIDIKINTTTGVLVTLIMDPVSDDKITARGYGPLQLQYETENDEARLYGKYTITEGLYNFSLQDVFLRDFRIQEGSTIAFNGDPLAAMLDIKAAYRVNTSLTDLDKSFAMDKDLNRTNVPVDAILLVSGPLDAPEINFDIGLPTLTDETVSKVRSIISTNDLMSRQILYLLALNRFYTPEYMNTNASGTMLTSVASSTISSQLGNALSQLTDKVSVMPSFRSEKGDFSDLEMDVALSSRLLNNRLIINGNFGYRDRTTSTTTFVGDFDVQYLLNRRGSFRLKAYNHFNDQNYYLRQALTTQGIGIEYRHDFNNLFKRRRPRPTDSVPPTP